jgi:2-isopropylmalate synthase
VRILDGKEATGATTRVLIDSRDEHRSWSTVGASPNIIHASLEALVDSIEYGLLQNGVRPPDTTTAPSPDPPLGVRATQG